MAMMMQVVSQDPPASQASKKKEKNKSGKPSRDLPFRNGCGEDLPIFAHKAELVASVRKHQTTIVMGETGSGKSTQLPKYLAEAFTSARPTGTGAGANAGAEDALWGNCVVCTQPRRVAAITVAQRVAAELQVSCGEEVGYAVRFDDCTSQNTRIKFVTDGVLMRECMTNADLSGYSVLILDEAHERSLNTDILMGIVRDLQDKNPRLRVVIMSATLQVGVFMDFFKDTNLIKIAGRQYPVETFYTAEAEADYLDAALRTCMHIHGSQPSGGVLVFLPGQEDIENLIMLLEENLPAVEAYRDRDEDNNSSDGGHDGGVRKKAARSLQTYTKVAAQSRAASDRNAHDASGSSSSAGNVSGSKVVVATFHDFEIRPLYASMPPDQQLEAFAPCADPSIRKFVISTNIAETSVTINDIVYVVDTGYFKCKLNDSATGMDMLKVVPVSKQQADQRRGRAGRTGPGQCYRVFPLEVFEKQLAEETIPEIQRVNLSQVILQLKTIGVKSPQAFPYVSKPSRESLRKAMEELYLLGALDGADADLTPLGQKMSLLPLEPMFANLLLQAARCVGGGFVGESDKPALYGCVQEMLTTVSMLSTEGVYLQPSKEFEKELARKKHRNLSVKAGDLPTLLHIYNSWVTAKQSKDWAMQNFLSQRVLQQASNIRQQLHSILGKICYNIPMKSPRHDGASSASSAVGATKSPFPSCLPHLEPYLKCLAVGLSLNVAQRVADGSAAANSSMSTLHGLQRGGAADRGAAPYVTLRGRQPVHVHPSSVLFSAATGHITAVDSAKDKGRGISAHLHKKSRLPAYVVYSDLLITSKSYMRGVTGMQGEWLLGPGDTPNTMFRKVPVVDASSPTAGSGAAPSAAGATAGQKRSFQHTSGAGTSAAVSTDRDHDAKKAKRDSRGLTPQALAASQGRAGAAAAGSGNGLISKYVPLSKQKKLKPQRA